MTLALQSVILAAVLLSTSTTCALQLIVVLLSTRHLLVQQYLVASLIPSILGVRYAQQMIIGYFNPVNVQQLASGATLEIPPLTVL